MADASSLVALTSHQSVKATRLSTINFLLISALFLTSGDIAFVVNLGGITLRLAQVLQILALGLFAITHFRYPIMLPPAIGYLIFVLAAAGAFVLNTPFPTRNIGYLVSFSICVLSVIAYSDYYGGSSERVKLLARWYIISTATIALFGLLQFAAGLAGYSLLTSQWLIPHRIARINGISYEPSYFAIYMIGAWGVLAALLEIDYKLFSRRVMWGLLLTITMAMVLSSSRSGIVVMYFAYIFLCITWIIRRFYGLPLGGWRLFLMIVGISVPVLILIYLLVAVPDVGGLLLSGIWSGNGFAGHSVDIRSDLSKQTLEIALKHPIVGVGIGGVGPTIAAGQNPLITFEDFLDARVEGLNVVLEVFAGTGFVGGLAFVLYLGFLSMKAVRAFPYRSSDAAIALGFTMGMIMQFALLMGAQNIIRSYVWAHIAVLSAALTCMISQENSRLISANPFHKVSTEL